ncbi:MAG: hypothetical protein H6686_10600 [Fibrobacteria bacterium]|nr:hypothetical protein [Fibrobacteria bacterium]
MIFRPVLLLPALLGLCISAAASRPVLPSLPEDDPAVPWLERLDGRDGCSLPDRRPWPGELVLACLESIDSTDLAPTDSVRIARLLRRLALRDSFPAGWGWRPAWSANRGDRTDHLLLDLAGEGYVETRFDSSGVPHRILGGRLRPRVDVLLGNQASMWARPFQRTEVADASLWRKEMDPRRGVYQTALFAGDGEASWARTVDGLEGGLEATALGVRLRSGWLRTSWGPLPEPLFLSGTADPFALTEASARVGPIEAVVLGGRLTGDAFDERRLLYGHRLRWVGRSWAVAWSEAVVSVNRPLEPLYLVPVFPVILTEHLLGDPDNRQMGFDASWRILPGIEIAGELFLDDLQNFLGFFSDGWGNKWALGVGLRLRDVSGPQTLDRLQATRIEPWVGGASSSILPGAPRNLPVHFGRPLGSPLGPNSLALLWNRRQDLSASWSLLSEVRAEWKGAGPGSSVDDLNWADSSGTWVVPHPRKDWMGTVDWTRQVLTLGAEFRPSGDWGTRWSVGLDVSDREGSRRFSPVVSGEVSFRE